MSATNPAFAAGYETRRIKACAIKGLGLPKARSSALAQEDLGHDQPVLQAAE
jgi:hypothetical protein